MLINLILSLIVVLAVGEILVRLLVTAKREPYYRFDPKNKLFKRKPRSDGRYKKKNVDGYYVFNNEGWNSTRDYFSERVPGTYRIACIGSSETGAYEVHVKEAYPKVIEDTLTKYGIKNEVYTFAEDRAIGLGHALHLTRYAIRNFSPDLILYNGSFVGEVLSDATDKKHYMFIKVDGNGNTKEILPRNESLPVLGREYSFKSILFRSKLIKFLRPHLAIRTRFRKAVRIARSIPKAFSQSNKVAHKAKKGLTRDERNLIARRYILDQFRKIQQEGKVKLLYVVKPVRDKSFNWHNMNTESQRLSMVDEINERISMLKEFSFPYFELGDVFTEDYKINKRKFDFFLNPHLNEHGHKVEGEAIANFLIRNKYFDSLSEQNSDEKSSHHKVSS